MACPIVAICAKDSMRLSIEEAQELAAKSFSRVQCRCRCYHSISPLEIAMPELILHHYPTSPFSEKIRLIFGAKKLAWQSVTIPRILPKPDVIALTGGYRKTPILQIGADIYCDSALIAKKLDALAPIPSLFPAKQAASVLA